MTEKAPFVLGLTGSIGMGKSTTLEMFRDLGVPVWDADAAVHKMYEQGGAAVVGIAAVCPEATKNGAVDRQILRDWVARDKAAIARIEAVVHPLVAKDRRDFLRDAGAKGTQLVVVDIPLLFETGGDKAVDATVVVSAPFETQKERVLARPDMTADLFDRIRTSQMPDSEKRQKADYVIETTTLAHARAQVEKLLSDLDERRTRDA